MHILRIGEKTHRFKADSEGEALDAFEGIATEGGGYDFPIVWDGPFGKFTAYPAVSVKYIKASFL